MQDNFFYLKNFSIRQNHAALKIGTDSILLGSNINPENAERILDIGTGTGILALMLAQKSNAMIDAIEIDKESAKDAEYNFRSSPWSSRILFYQRSLQEYCVSSSFKYDLIICNPPYFQNSLLSPYGKKNIAKHSVSLSIEDLIICSERLLKENGRLAIICPQNISESIDKIADKYNLEILRQIWIKPTIDKPVNRTIMEYCRQSNIPMYKTVVIENSTRHDYSEWYKESVKDYLLKF